MKGKSISTIKLVTIATMAAIICVVTFFRFPLLGTKVHLANAMCLLAGLLLGGVPGGIAAGLGSGIYDVMYGYDIIQVGITFASKFLMAYVCYAIACSGKREGKHHGCNVLACVVGALTYVGLYMLKTFIYQKFVYGYPMETAWVTMGSKLPGSLINAVAAMVVAPVLYTALRPALERSGFLNKLK